MSRRADRRPAHRPFRTTDPTGRRRFAARDPGRALRGAARRPHGRSHAHRRRDRSRGRRRPRHPPDPRAGSRRRCDHHPGAGRTHGPRCGRGRLAPPVRSARDRDHRQHRQDLDQGSRRRGPSQRFRTLWTEGNRNNEVGLPLTVLVLGPEHEAVVLEMGMYVGGEIADLARIGRPSIGVITAVHAVHLSRIGSLDAIEAGKRELLEALPADGPAVLNADDARVRGCATARRRTDPDLWLRRRRRRRGRGRHLGRARRDDVRRCACRRAATRRRSLRSAGWRCTTPWPRRRSV